MSPFSRARVYQEATRREIQLIVDKWASRESPARVLDAGCGYELPLDLEPDVRLVGIDTSPDAIAKNENVDEAIVGDVETHSFGEGTFDAVVCWAVLEHLKRPEMAFQNLARALRPGGLLVIGVPNLWSIKGLITKVTPYAFHVWVYRRLLGYPDAGKPGFGPYRTYLKLAVSPPRLIRLARANNLEVVYVRTYGSPPDQLPRAVLKVWNGVAIVIRFVVRSRRTDPNASEFAVVFRKIA